LPPTFNVLALEFQIINEVSTKKKKKSDVHAIVTLVATNTLHIKKNHLQFFSTPTKVQKNYKTFSSKWFFFVGYKVLLAHT
jgi:hypothetical protein